MIVNAFGGTRIGKPNYRVTDRGETVPASGQLILISYAACALDDRQLLFSRASWTPSLTFYFHENRQTWRCAFEKDQTGPDKDHKKGG
jgi:hypothetical protein